MTTNYRNTLVLALALVSTSFAACGQSVSERAQNDQVTYVKEDDPVMARAFERARAELDDFLKLAKSPKEGTEGYALKVAVTEGDQTEYFWVGDFEATGDDFSGVLNNEPETVKKYKFGERFTFTRDQVVDWTYMEPAARRMHGNYTACALLTHEDPKEAEEFKRQYGLRCD